MSSFAERNEVVAYNILPIKKAKAEMRPIFWTMPSLLILVSPCFPLPIVSIQPNRGANIIPESGYIALTTP